LTFSIANRFSLVASKRECIYPNVGFQLQLCLFEKLGKDFDQVDAIVARGTFHVESELAVSIRKTLENAEERMDRMFDDDALCEDASRWEDFGFFIQNCREYLGHVDIGLPLSLLDRADDCSRKLGNLDKVFEGAGVATAGRVGRVLGAWHGLQNTMAASETAAPRTDASYVSALDRDLASSSAKRRKT